VDDGGRWCGLPAAADVRRAWGCVEGWQRVSSSDTLTYACVLYLYCCDNVRVVGCSGGSRFEQVLLRRCVSGRRDRRTLNDAIVIQYG
jgi:hypothetical protein